MAKKRHPQQGQRREGRPPGGAQHAAPSRKIALRVARVAGTDTWELVHPRCARERALDLEEVRAMLEAGETDVARDELRWLLEGCSDLVEAHRLLGEIAAAEGDLKLARGHFGYAYQITLAAFPQRDWPGPLPYARPANSAFFEAAKGLAWCYLETGQPQRALDVLQTMLRLDPSDPVGARAMLDQARGSPPGDR